MMAMGMLPRSRLHDGYALVSDSETALTGDRAQLRQSQRRHHVARRPAASKIRDAVVLIALVVALCVGFASVIWEPRQLKFPLKRHELYHHSKQANAANITAGDEGVASKAVGPRAGEQFAFRESRESAPSAISVNLSSSPLLVEDGGDLIVFWKSTSEGVVQKQDFLTLSCGPTTGNNDFLQRKNVSETDAASNSVRFSGTYCTQCILCAKGWSLL